MSKQLLSVQACYYSALVYETYFKNTEFYLNFYFNLEPRYQLRFNFK